MTNTDISRYGKKMLSFFWDPTPANDPSQGTIWCLGREYESSTSHAAPPSANPSSSSKQQGSPSASSAATEPSSPPALSISQASEASTAPTSINTATGTTQQQQQQQQGKQAQEDADLREYEHVTPSEPEAENGEDKGWPPPFLDDFESRVWMTYRSGFAPIPRSQDARGVSFAVRLRTLTEKDGFTSDTGWGCMIRSGQSLLANALLVTRLGRDWRRRKGRGEHGGGTGGGGDGDGERELLALFADDARAPFSIHRFVEHGAAHCGKHPGEWFGPSATAQSIQALADGVGEGAGMRVYITGDGSDVYEDKFMQTAKRDGKFTPTLILVGTRLGIDRVTPVYWEALKSALKMKQSIGIAGGRPSASHYFVGTQGQFLFYLDPHVTRPALPLHAQPSAYTAEEVDSCHLRRLRRIHLDEMDPSMLIGFLVRDEADWRDWRAALGDVKGKPIVHVADSEPSPYDMADDERASAVDEVEAFDDDDLNDDGGGGGGGAEAPVGR